LATAAADGDAVGADGDAVTADGDVVTAAGSRGAPCSVADGASLLDGAIGAWEGVSAAAGVGAWWGLGVCDCAAVANATASIPAKRFISPT